VELNLTATDLKADLILLTETWLNPSSNTAILDLDNYVLQHDLRKDRQDTAAGVGGGLLVYARKGITILSCDTVGQFNQYVKFVLDDKGTRTHFYLVYRPPRNDRQNMEELRILIQNAEPETVMIGDFNLPGVEWGTAGSTGCQLAEEAADKNFVQLIDFPTHTKGNILDLILTNVPEKIVSVWEEGRLGKSDHSIIMLEFLCKSETVDKRGEVRNWKRADWDGIKRGLSDEVWPTAEDETTTEEAWRKLRCKLDELIDENVPKVKLRTRISGWMTRDILREIRRKRRLWKKAKDGSAEDKYLYSEAEKKTRNMIRNAKRKEEKKLSVEKEKNSKPFYNYIKKRTKARTPIGPLKGDDGRNITDPEEMADTINEFFVSVFTREDTTEIPTPRKKRIWSKLKKCWVTTAMVKAKIKELRPNSAPGPDGISAKVLKQCSDEIAPVLAMIYRKSMLSGSVPEEWRQANIVPIFKKGSKAKPGNYRPVSLTSVCCKVIEKIVRDQIVCHLKRNNLISKSQHGFVNNRSCTTNLLEYLEDITRGLDEGKSLDVIYLDFAKAFDKVPVARLMKKLESFGVEGEVLRWVKSWLTNRKQRVLVDGAKSSWREVLSGVPQGSVLGPVLFVIFINDLEDTVTANQILKMFADDTKVGQDVSGADGCEELQNTLNRLWKWVTDWGMAFNVEKCHVMHFGKNNSKHKYEMDGRVLEESAKEKDVGVLISNDGKPSAHVKKAASTATAVLNQILRTFHYRDRITYLRLYAQYVRPHLEFAAPAWSPWTVSDKECIESVQKKAIKAVSGLKGKTYEERLSELDFPTLEQRRNEADLIQAYKIIHGLDNVDKGQWFKILDGEGVTRAQQGRLKLRQHRSRLDLRANFFSQRVIPLWNNLPEELRTCRGLQRFKNALRALSRTGGAGL